MNVSAEDDGPKWVEMPSMADQGMSVIDPGEPYHDLGMRFPDAPSTKVRWRCHHP